MKFKIHAFQLNERHFIFMKNVERIITIIDKTDAGLNGLCIRDFTLICDVINMYNNY